MFILFKKIFFFIIALAMIDYVLGICLHSFYFHQKKEWTAHVTYSLDSAKPDILILGSSRAERHYSPSILSDSLHKSCYNAGMDAQSIPYCTALQEVIFKRWKPKMIILDINPWEFIEDTIKYEKLSILLPYCNEHPELIKYLEIASPMERLKLYSNIYPYNSTFFIAVNDKLHAQKMPTEEFGYAPIIKVMDAAEITLTKKALLQDEKKDKDFYVKTDAFAFNLYRQFLKRCTDNHIKTYVITSPTLIPGYQNKSKKELLSISKTYPEIKFIDFSSNPNYNGHFEKFSDHIHLNKQGSEEFSKELAGRLKKLG
ncbi:hypothetical protein [Parasediminibacterium sp. JCM 36343]|uniref:hypothetical protein n=1 Tax=Parasediminibacterium sp. JCM 36343 TaxID=3374279 RepID=UPI003978E799